MSKYGMSLCTLGFAGEFAPTGIAANSLWPRTTIGTAAVRNLLGGEVALRRARTPDIMADAAHAILTRDSRACSGNFYIDEDVLRDEGVTDFSRYLLGGTEEELDLDFFLPARRSPAERPDRGIAPSWAEAAARWSGIRRLLGPGCVLSPGPPARRSARPARRASPGPRRSPRALAGASGSR